MIEHLVYKTFLLQEFGISFQYRTSYYKLKSYKPIEDKTLTSSSVDPVIVKSDHFN